jgi:hypothetical protein
MRAIDYPQGMKAFFGPSAVSAPHHAIRIARLRVVHRASTSGTGAAECMRASLQ